jgi:hypothetical protein
MSFMKGMKDKVGEEPWQNVFHNADEGQNAKKNRKKVLHILYTPHKFSIHYMKKRKNTGLG